MKLINNYCLEVKKSKFIGYFYNIENLDDVDLILDNLKKEHKKAKHYPYAYILNNNIKKSDDKEPSGTCGTPILNVLERNNLRNHLIVIFRYFGVFKLGVGPLLRCYSKVANEVIKYNIIHIID